MANSWVRFNNTSLRWELSTNQGAGWADLLDAPYVDRQLFEGRAAPSASGANQGKLYYDSTADRVKISENAGGYTDIVPVGMYTSSWIDPNGTGTKGSWDGYIRTACKWPFNCTVTNVWIQVIGGTNAIVNVYRSGAWLRNGHQTVTQAGGYAALTPLQSQAFTAGQAIFPYVSSISGAVTQISFAIIFTRP